jgi:hypothetical protein
VSEANGKGIGLIGCGVMTKSKERPGHEGNLFLFCGAFSRGGFFDEFGRIFMDGEPRPSGSEEGGSASGSEDDGGSGVLDVDDEFDGEGFGGVLGNQFGEVIVNFDQAVLRGTGSRVFDCAGGQNNGFFCSPFKDGVAGSPEGGVESEDPHGKRVPSGVKLSRKPVSAWFDHEKRSVRISI